MLTPSLEDYLEEIYRLSINQGFIRITDVARKLQVSLPLSIKLSNSSLKRVI